MKTRTKVKIVKTVPALNHMTMTSGVRDQTAAESWGAKYGYGEVFYLPRLQRVYADKMSAVAAKAEEIEQRSEDLVVLAETNSYGLGSEFLSAAAAGIFVGVDYASGPDSSVCQMECVECRFVTPHELLDRKWSCTCCGTICKA